MQLRVAAILLRKQNGFLMIECLIALILAAYLGAIIIYYCQLMDNWRGHATETFRLVQDVREYIAGLRLKKHQNGQFEAGGDFGKINCLLSLDQISNVEGSFPVKAQLPGFYLVTLKTQGPIFKTDLAISTGICK